MKKTFSLAVSFGIAALLAISSGCSLCCAPYDYCGPVYADGQCANLARLRCGTAFNGGGAGCASCGLHGTPAQNAMPQPQGMNPSVPVASPTQAPATAQVAPSAPVVTGSVQPQYRPASVAQTPVVTADSSLQVTQPTQETVLPENGTIAVGADGYARVAVYDENNQLLGYEMVDSTGKSMSQVPAPASAQ